MKYKLLGIVMGCVILLLVAGVVYAATLFNKSAVVETTITGNPTPIADPIEGSTFLTNGGFLNSGTTYQKDSVLTFTNNSGKSVTVTINQTPGYTGSGSYSGPTTVNVPANGQATATLSINTSGLYNGTYQIPLTIIATY